MENPEKISLQFELLNTYYSKIACKMSHTPPYAKFLQKKISVRTQTASSVYAHYGDLWKIKLLMTLMVYIHDINDKNCFVEFTLNNRNATIFCRKSQILSLLYHDNAVFCIFSLQNKLFSLTLHRYTMHNAQCTNLNS